MLDALLRYRTHSNGKKDLTLLEQYIQALLDAKKASVVRLLLELWDFYTMLDSAEVTPENPTGTGNLQDIPGISKFAIFEIRAGNGDDAGVFACSNSLLIDKPDAWKKLKSPLKAEPRLKAPPVLSLPQFDEDRARRLLARVDKMTAEGIYTSDELKFLRDLANRRTVDSPISFSLHYQPIHPEGISSTVATTPPALPNPNLLPRASPVVLFATRTQSSGAQPALPALAQPPNSSSASLPTAPHVPAPTLPHLPPSVPAPTSITQSLLSTPPLPSSAQAQARAPALRPSSKPDEFSEGDERVPRRILGHKWDADQDQFVFETVWEDGDVSYEIFSAFFNNDESSGPTILFIEYLEANSLTQLLDPDHGVRPAKKREKEKERNEKEKEKEKVEEKKNEKEKRKQKKTDKRDREEKESESEGKPKKKKQKAESEVKADGNDEVESINKKEHSREKWKKRRRSIDAEEKRLKEAEKEKEHERRKKDRLFYEQQRSAVDPPIRRKKDNY